MNFNESFKQFWSGRLSCALRAPFSFWSLFLTLLAGLCFRVICLFFFSVFCILLVLLVSYVLCFSLFKTTWHLLFSIYFWLFWSVLCFFLFCHARYISRPLSILSLACFVLLFCFAFDFCFLLFYNIFWCDFSYFSGCFVVGSLSCQMLSMTPHKRSFFVDICILP